MIDVLEISAVAFIIFLVILGMKTALIMAGVVLGVSTLLWLAEKNRYRVDEGWYRGSKRGQSGK